MHNVHNVVYVSMKAGSIRLNDHFLSFSGLRSRNKVPKTPYNLLLARAPLPTSHSTASIRMDSLSEKNDEKSSYVSVHSQQVDTGAQLDASLHTQLDPNESLIIR